MPEARRPRPGISKLCRGCGTLLDQSLVESGAEYHWLCVPRRPRARALHSVPPPPDPVEARRRRDEGVTQALDHADDWWKDGFRRAYRHLLSTGQAFTSEDIVYLVGTSPTHPSAVGALMGSLVNPDREAGLIEYLGHVKSKNPISHGSLIGQYRGMAP